jgi:uncharacterized protein (DUF2236 family)
VAALAGRLLVLPAGDDALLALARPEGLPAGARGLFREDCWLRRVAGAPVAIFGGGRALLLEVAHPFVAAGVAEHSAYRSDPFGRLQRTLAAMSAITFGELPDALAAARAVERAHARVRGVLPEDAGRFAAGTPYSGRDPEAVRWVWATLADTALAIYERFVEPLAPAAHEAYYADQRVLARVLGVAAELVPSDWAAFRSYFDAMLAGDTLAVTPLAREVAQAVLHPPAQLEAGPVARSITAGLLPPRLREAYGLEWDAGREAQLEALVASVRSLRGAPGGRPGCDAGSDRSPSVPHEAGEHMAGEPDRSEEGGGKVDAVSILYIVGGMPAIVMFVVILFTLTRSCALPA